MNHEISGYIAAVIIGALSWLLNRAVSSFDHLASTLSDVKERLVRLEEHCKVHTNAH